MKNVIFVPGGPWISGKYWDYFLNSFEMSNVKVQRHVLKNHEDEYRKIGKTNLSELKEKLKQEILIAEEPVILVGHSFGAWLSLLATDADTISKIEKVVIVAMPLSLEKPSEFENSLKKLLINQNFKTNEEFAVFFSNILDFYFFSPENSKRYKDISEISFLECNEEAILGETDFATVLKKLGQYADKIYGILASEDMITGDITYSGINKMYHIKGSGHFPMLENPEKFSQILKSIL